jgi:dihydroneopterin aldolase
MRDVFSYDLITDGIRMLIASGHVALVETLAERIAAMLLAHPRVVKASVRLEKLDTGAGVVGVALERTRANAPAIGQVLPQVPPQVPPASSGEAGAGRPR